MSLFLLAIAVVLALVGLLLGMADVLGKALLIAGLVLAVVATVLLLRDRV